MPFHLLYECTTRWLLESKERRPQSLPVRKRKRKMGAGTGFNAAAVAVPTAVAGGGRSGSDAAPLLYLFGGLAAMLGLVGVALILLACAYWKLSGHFDRGGAERDAKLEPATAAPATFYDQGIVVVMAGDEKPTYLATPIPSGASSFGGRSSKDEDEDDKEGGDC